MDAVSWMDKWLCFVIYNDLVRWVVRKSTAGLVHQTTRQVCMLITVINYHQSSPNLTNDPYIPMTWNYLITSLIIHNFCVRNTNINLHWQMERFGINRPKMYQINVSPRALIYSWNCWNCIETYMLIDICFTIMITNSKLLG